MRDRLCVIPQVRGPAGPQCRDAGVCPPGQKAGKALGSLEAKEAERRHLGRALGGSISWRGSAQWGPSGRDRLLGCVVGGHSARADPALVSSRGWVGRDRVEEPG